MIHGDLEARALEAARAGMLRKAGRRLLMDTAHGPKVLVLVRRSKKVYVMTSPAAWARYTERQRRSLGIGYPFRDVLAVLPPQT